MIDDWSQFENFESSEFACTHCGKCDMHPRLILILQTMRDQLQKPIFISSGYRCAEHPVEAMKDKPGEHTKGLAVDVICHGDTALTLLKMAQNLGVERLGFHQKGRASGRFIHLGIGDKFTKEFPRAIWTY